jgi:hypothetical protein
VHQLFVKTNVTAFFHGHDHIFAEEELDGVVYLEVPHAANSGYGVGFDTNANDYADGTMVNNSGHVRVTVSPSNARIEYVRSWLPGASGVNGQIAYAHDVLPCSTRDDDDDGVGNCTDLCPSDPAKQTPGQCGCNKPDLDADGDGVADCRDVCPNDPLHTTSVGACGCGRPETEGCCSNGQCIPTTFLNVRVGTGSSPLTASSTVAFIEERSMVDGALLATYPLPTVEQGDNKRLTLAGTAQAEGTLKRSVDGHWVTVAGYSAEPGVDKVAAKASTAVPRVVARMGADHVLDSRAVVTGAFNGGSSGNGTPRSVISATGAEYWAMGTGTSNSGGIWYGTFGGGTPVQILGQSNNAPTDVRFCGILGNQLYASTASSSIYGVFTVGTGGLPTSKVAGGALLNGFSTAAGPSPFDFVVLDRDPLVDGADTIYLADDRAITTVGSGIQKWLLSGTTWARNKIFTTGLSTGIRHLTAFEMGDTVVLLGTTTSTPNAIVRIFDNPGDGVATVFVTAPDNTAIRGISGPPTP